MKTCKKVLASSLAVLTLVGVSALATTKDASAAQVTTATLKKAGKIKVGVKVDVPHFGYQDPDTKKNEGMEIDLAKQLAKDITGSSKNVEFTGVTAKTRGPVVDNGQVDMDISTFTITPERKKSYNFSTPYFTDQVGFLVLKSGKYTDTKSLKGKTIGIAQTTTTKASLEAKAKELGVTFKYSEFASYPELKTALTSKRIDAFAVDKSILIGYKDSKTEILFDGFAPQEYGVVTKKSNKKLAKSINNYIKKYKKDGTMQKLYDKWDLTDASDSSK